MSERNPDSNPIAQGLIDLIDAGCGSLTINQALTKINHDTKLRADLGTQFNQRGYNDDRIKYSQISKDAENRLMKLSNSALKILIFLGLNCNQDGYISCKKNIINKVTGISIRAIPPLIRELKETCCIREAYPSVRHEPPIWQIDPGIIYCGKRNLLERKKDNFWCALSHQHQCIEPMPDLFPVASSIYKKLPDGTKLYYHKIDLEPFESANKKSRLPKSRLRTQTKKAVDSRKVDDQDEIFN